MSCCSMALDSEVCVTYQFPSLSHTLRVVHTHIQPLGHISQALDDPVAGSQYCLTWSKGQHPPDLFHEVRVNKWRAYLHFPLKKLSQVLCLSLCPWSEFSSLLLLKSLPSLWNKGNTYCFPLRIGYVQSSRNQKRPMWIAIDTHYHAWTLVHTVFEDVRMKESDTSNTATPVFVTAFCHCSFKCIFNHSNNSQIHYCCNTFKHHAMC